MLTLSVILPCYEDGESLLVFLPQLDQVLQREGLMSQIIVVDDGSSSSVRQFLESVDIKSELFLISLPKNFGHQFALRAGLIVAKTDLVAMMDSDGQHSPETLAEMLELGLREQKSVMTSRLSTEEISVLKRYSSSLFYRLCRVMTGSKIAHGSSDFRFLTRDDLEIVLNDRPESSFWRGKSSRLNDTLTLEYHAGTRIAGESRFTLKKMLELSVVGFDFANLRLTQVRRALFSLILVSFALDQLGAIIFFSSTQSIDLVLRTVFVLSLVASILLQVLHFRIIKMRETAAEFMSQSYNPVRISSGGTEC